MEKREETAYVIPAIREGDMSSMLRERISTVQDLLLSIMEVHMTLEIQTAGINERKPLAVDFHGKDCRIET